MPEVPHTLDAVRVSQHLANTYIDTARHNNHAPESPEQELAMLIYSTPPIFSARFEVSVSSQAVPGRVISTGVTYRVVRT